MPSASEINVQFIHLFNSGLFELSKFEEEIFYSNLLVNEINIAGATLSYNKLKLNRHGLFNVYYHENWYLPL